MQLQCDENTLVWLKNNLGAAQKLTDDAGSAVFDRPVQRAPLPRIPLLDCRKVTTLDAFAEYVKSDPDDLRDDGVEHVFWVHVESPCRVVYVGPPNDNREREIPLLAECPVQDVSALARFQPPDDLVPVLLGMAKDRRPANQEESETNETFGDLTKILRYMRKTVREHQEVQEDDGGGQTTKTTTKAGPVEWTHEDNPLSLAPWSTFPEVEQPLRLFVFRWNQAGQFKLAATPDERWRLEAVQSVATYLKAKLGDNGPPVFA